METWKSYVNLNSLLDERSKFTRESDQSTQKRHVNKLKKDKLKQEVGEIDEFATKKCINHLGTTNLNATNKILKSYSKKICYCKTIHKLQMNLKTHTCSVTCQNKKGVNL